MSKIKYILLGLGMAAVVMTVGLSTMFLEEGRDNGQDSFQQAEEKDGQEESRASAKQTDQETEQGAGESLSEDLILTDERQIEGQNIQVALSGIGEVIFTSYAPKWEENPNGDVMFALLNLDGTVRQILYGTREGNQRAAGERFDSVTAVEFRDCNGDGYEDVIMIAAYSYETGSDAEKGFSEIRVYHNNGKELVFQREISAEATSQLAEPTIDDVLVFLNAYNGGLPYGRPVNFDRDSLPVDFADAIENYCHSGILPDGRIVGIPGVFSYAVCDIDMDGKEELVLQNTHTATAGMAEWIYACENGVFREELCGFPRLTYYDNGIVHEGWSHNQGKAGDRIWPYTLYQYRPETDSYDTLGSVDAWDRELADSLNFYGEFPDAIDKDGDGCVYFLLPADWEGDYRRAVIVDGSEHEEWLNQYLNGAEELEIPYQELHVEMIYPAAVG